MDVTKSENAEQTTARIMNSVDCGIWNGDGFNVLHGLIADALVAAVDVIVGKVVPGSGTRACHVSDPETELFDEANGPASSAMPK